MKETQEERMEKQFYSKEMRLFSNGREMREDLKYPIKHPVLMRYI